VELSRRTPPLAHISCTEGDARSGVLAAVRSRTDQQARGQTADAATRVGIPTDLVGAHEHELGVGLRLGQHVARDTDVEDFDQVQGVSDRDVARAVAAELGLSPESLRQMPGVARREDVAPIDELFEQGTQNSGLPELARTEPRDDAVDLDRRYGESKDLWVFELCRSAVRDQVAPPLVAIERTAQRPQDGAVALA
jgi:hypothetical protein